MTKKTITYAITIFSFLLLPLTALADGKQNKGSVKKILSTARTNIKKGTNLADAETSLRQLLNDTANIDNEKIWLTLFDAVKKQYEQLNEQLYLKQTADTAKLFTHTLHMFDVLESMDSIDASHNLLSAPKYRKAHAAYLAPYRANLFSGGGYYLQKQDYPTALTFFASYVGTAPQPLFSGYYYMAQDSIMPSAAYWALLCGYKLQRPDLIAHYAPLASRDKSMEVYVRQYLAEASLMTGDSATYRRRLEEGNGAYPSHSYFFPSLLRLYGQQGLTDSIATISRRVLEKDSTNVLAMVSLSSALLEKGDNSGCRLYAERALAADSLQTAAWRNIGMAYYSDATPLTKKKRPTRADRKQLSDIYRKALPYLATYREMAPGDSSVWATPLYNIYLNLNMGEEFEEIEEIINNM